MSDLRQFVDLQAFCASENVYKTYLKAAASDRTKLNLFLHLIDKKDFIVPDEVFKWIAESESDFYTLDICILLQRKQCVDGYIDAFLHVCERDQIENLNYAALEFLMTTNYLDNTLTYKCFIYKLLSDNRWQNLGDIFYPVENIRKNYRRIDQCVDEFMCRAAYLANHKALSTFYESLEIINYDSFAFQPSQNQEHRRIFNWIKKNIVKGEANPEIPLGWTEGPDSTKWPSIKLDDYKKTLHVISGSHE
ncbi:hypothetical protein Zmor_015785 [Zophobas morio]|uniref:Uncharacterized protein n=3 Tax=cellular organisms TaxID=131567 RepID=A0AA38I9F6_9CUCU|nr:hypothetical protein Zmor_008614 [Zophobas morio]KAJ3641065.1 hypothetical protein Zmor_027588 [Zophobas morio]KAJ3644244.1 hypothetical protein Zmor_026912 [Zophobas morio]KAJ3649193.1 hypothetical protein Zmor_020948 [Zophobas morio]KAJ3649709.1 hypothetical protein Zmor_021434 [Zophobas morio]